MDQAKDIHSALRTTEVGTLFGEGIEAKLVRLQSGRTDTRFSLHIAPNSYSMSGVQTTDILTYFGFERTACAFLPLGGYCKAVSDDFDLPDFIAAFSQASPIIEASQGYLTGCGLALPQPEGIGYFRNQASRGSRGMAVNTARGDGHTSPNQQRLKEAADNHFRFVLTWLTGGADKGWVIHYQAGDSEQSQKLLSALKFFPVTRFASCPEFEFEECYWRYIPFGDREQVDFFRAENVHQVFDAHAQSLSQGLEKLLSADELMRPFGMSFLTLNKKTSLPARTQIVAVKPNAPEKASATQPAAPNKAIMTDVPKRLKVFLCHGSEDKSAVRDIHSRLSTLGIQPWLDEADLLPGQDWNREIKRAVRNSDIVLVCLSKTSVTKSGYIQKEIKLALDVADEKPEGTIFLIPAKLEQCDMLDRLIPWQWVNLYEEDGFERLKLALEARAIECGISM